MSTTGVLLLNLGTPDKANHKAVFKYLKEFLNDPRVIDLPALFRYILSNFIIVPFRYQKSTAAYQKIWNREGSPLLYNTLNLAQRLSQELNDTYQVEIGMRYGNPSIDSAYQKLKRCDKIIVIPLFPQYSSAATGSAIEKFLQCFGKEWNIPHLSITKDFYNHPGYIKAYANIINKSLHNKTVDLLLFSYHGIPERHIHKSACQATCDKVGSCPSIEQHNLYCYRAQCYESTRLILKQLTFNAPNHHVAFQSRLGKTPWIKPYTDKVLVNLIQQGIKNIAVVCPSFIVDCLETLEEINLRTREQWKAIGGHDFTFIPCLNDDITWTKALAEMVQC